MMPPFVTPILYHIKMVLSTKNDEIIFAKVVDKTKIV